MSRKAREVEGARLTGTYTTARTLGATLGYSSLKPYQLPDHLVVVIYLPAVAAQEDQGHGSPIGHVLPAVQRLLMADPERFAPPDALFLIDCTPLIPPQTTPRAVVDKENSAPKLGKKLGKPVGRLLERLLVGHRGSVTLVGVEFGASVALNLLQAPAAEHGVKDLGIRRALLIHPMLSASHMNPQPSESVQTSPHIDAYFKSRGALERLIPSVRRVFSNVASHVVDVAPMSDVSSAIGGVLYSALLSDCMRDGPPLSDIDGARLDPDACDAMGRCVFWSEVTVEMRRDSKQPEVPTVDPPAGDSLPQRDVPSGDATGPLATLHEVVRASSAEGIPRLLPVTVLSGFLGAGKTTLLTHLLENSSGYRIAVIVNDMASVNIDAELVRRASVLQKEEKMVELSNGCICCTLREDLLSSLAELAAENRFDHVIVESSGISEPLPVAETFTFEDEATGTSLAKVASLYNLVTVVDSPSLFESLASEDSLADRNWEAGDGDERVISQLLCEQLEFADVLVVNKSDLIGDDELDTVEQFVRQLNPDAEIIRTSRGRLEPSLLLDKARFSQQRAEAHPGWLAEAREHEHKPETLEYGISSFIFRARRPFHPERLHAALGSRPRPGALGDLLRLKGITWLATRHDTQAHAALAGTQFSLAPGPPWWDAIPRELWPEGLAEDIQPLWHDEHADRQTELVCIGRHLNHAAAKAALRECLLTDDEMAAGAAVWAALRDPFAEAWEAAMAPADSHGHEH